MLDVPPVQLLSPLDSSEALRVVPGEEKGPLDAAEWLANEDAVLEAVRPAATARERDTERILRYRESPLTVLRQFRVTARTLRYHDRSLEIDRQRGASAEAIAFDENSVTVMALRLLRLAASLEAHGYCPPMDRVTEILARHGFPATATLAELEKLAAEDREGEPDGPGAWPVVGQETPQDFKVIIADGALHLNGAEEQGPRDAVVAAVDCSKSLWLLRLNGDP